MEKDKKSNALLLIVIGVLTVILIAIVVMIVINKNNTSKELDNSTDNMSEVDMILSNYDVKCEIPEDGKDPKITYYENIKTDGDRVLTTQGSVLLEYSTETAYEEGKKNPDYQNGKFDDKNLKIEYILGAEVDYTKSETDEEITFNLDEYVSVLEESGYSCKNNK